MYPDVVYSKIDIWEQGIYWILHMLVVNMYVKSYLQNTRKKIPALTETDKKFTYPDSCLQKGHIFSLFAIAVDNVIFTEVDAQMKRISTRLSTRWRLPYSSKFGYEQSKVTMHTLISIHRYIRDLRVLTIHISVQRPWW